MTGASGLPFLALPLWTPFPSVNENTFCWSARYGAFVSMALYLSISVCHSKQQVLSLVACSGLVGAFLSGRSSLEAIRWLGPVRHFQVYCKRKVWAPCIRALAGGRAMFRPQNCETLFMWLSTEQPPPPDEMINVCRMFINHKRTDKEKQAQL